MISSWSTCHKILHILMFITSFEEQNITYRSCSNFRIHLSLQPCIKTKLTITKINFNISYILYFWRKAL
ncbi:hypothetical protein GPS57_16310 [Acinetobacter haemolyticus]|nr:hypothetical protein [Acinetobacter haemolyticus]